MVVSRYILPEHQTQRRKHHEEMVRRLISSPRSRCAANTYIYRCDTDERENITRILNQWDKSHYSTQPTGHVINKEAVSDIKEWCSNSSGKDLVAVKNFLQHLTNEQTKNNEEMKGETSQKANRPSYSRNNSLQLSSRRPEGLARHDSITSGSFYPPPFEGRGNSTGMFNIVRNPPQPTLENRPKTTNNAAKKKPQKPESAKMERHQTLPSMNRSEAFEIPVNNGGVFGEVIRPPPQTQSKRPLSKRLSNSNYPSNRPNTRGQWNRSRTIHVASKQGNSQIPRPFTQGSRRQSTESKMLQKRESNESQMIKYSANMQGHEDDVTAREMESTILQSPPQQYQQQQHQQQYYNDVATPHILPKTGEVHHRERYNIEINNDAPSRQRYYAEDSWMDNSGDVSHRPIAVSGRAPGRYWQPSQIF